MKFKSKKSILGLIGFSALGLGMVVGLPLALTSCGSTTSVTPNRPDPQPEEPQLDPNPSNPASNITVAINEIKQNDGSISLQAIANDKNNVTKDFGYQWYYQQKPSQFYGSSTDLVEAKATIPSGWTIIDNQVGQTLNIAAKYVVPSLSNYHFMCVVYNLNNKEESCSSKPINIPNIPQKEISLSTNAMTDLMDNFTKKLTVENIQNMVTGSVTGVNQWVECKPEVFNTVCQSLFGQTTNDLINPIKSVEVSLGNNWANDQYGFSQNVSLNLRIVLNDGNYALSEEMTSQSQTGAYNNKLELNVQGNVITVTHLATNITLGKITNIKHGQFAPLIAALQEAHLTATQGTIVLNNSTLGVYQAFANYFGLPLPAISNINLVFGTTDHSNKMNLTVYVNGYDCGELENDNHGDPSGCSMTPNGVTEVMFDLTIPSPSSQ